LMGVLEDWIALVVIEFPAGSGDDFVVAVERFVGGNKIQTRIARIITDIADFGGQGGAQAGAAVRKLDKTGGEFRDGKHGNDGRNENLKSEDLKFERTLNQEDETRKSPLPCPLPAPASRLRKLRRGRRGEREFFLLTMG